MRPPATCPRGAAPLLILHQRVRLSAACASATLPRQLMRAASALTACRVCAKHVRSAAGQLRQGLPEPGDADRRADPHHALLGLRVHPLQENPLVHGLLRAPRQADTRRWTARSLRALRISSYLAAFGSRFQPKSGAFWLDSAEKSAHLL